MKLTINQTAPDFSVTDVFGTPISLSNLKGRKVYIAFERNAGCPVCNLRTHELLKQAEAFSQHQITVLMIYESSPEKMRGYLEHNNYPFHFIADPQNELYKKYAVEKSILKVIRSMANGLMGKVNAGTKLFKQPIKQDGAIHTIPAEFMVDELGKLRIAHYGRFVGDHLGVDVVLKG